MTREVGQWVVRRFIQVAMGLTSLFVVLVLVAGPAWAVPAAPQLSVDALNGMKASLLATGFPAQATVQFTVTVGNCVGHASAVASTPTLLAEFTTAAPCTGVAVATATAAGQSATTTF